ncbi:MAG TPA: hypothetical protein VHF50_04815 [Solirubrobacterales bacterium]|nr:hypothetical protein [Solirubrobacterales bacterium]
MEAMRMSWTDDRLDDLNGKVDYLRTETRDEFKGVRDEFKAVRTEMQAMRSEMHTRFDSMQTLMVLVICAVIGGFVTMSATLIATNV